MDGTNLASTEDDKVGYDADFYAWSVAQARLIRTLAVLGLDGENVAEEIESLGRSDKRELLSRSIVLLVHLLKWQFQPERRGESWAGTISEQRRGLAILLEESPSLRSQYPDTVERAYRYARGDAAKETGLPLRTFPDYCVWPASQILQDDWLPE